MKKSFFCIIAIIVVTVLVGCENRTVDIAGLVAERDSIKDENMRQQQELDGLNSFVGTISQGLDSISMQEGFLRTQSLEGGVMTREQIKQSLSEFASLLARQRDRISKLEDSLKTRKDADGVNNMHNIIAYLNEQLESKEKIISQLRAELTNKNINIAQLQSKISALNESVEKLDKKNKIQQKALMAQTEMINECYMKISTKKQLKQAGILNGKKINPSGLIPENFVRVDVRQLKELTIMSSRPKILTTMPAGSYSIVRNSDKTSTLIINNPTLFWSSSNYLVIMTD